MLKPIETSTTPSAAKCRVFGVKRKMLPFYWDEARALLRPAIDRSAGRMTEELLEQQLAARDVQLWVAEDEFDVVIGAWVSQICIYQGAKVCELLYCGGSDIQLWLDEGLNTVEEWARFKGCGSITIVGRLGWGRMTRHRDYHHFATVIEKDLKNG